jgi:hypothetical protein
MNERIIKRYHILKMFESMKERYEEEALDEIFEGIKKIVENVATIDLQKIGELFLEFGKDPSLADEVIEEFEEWGL